MAYLNNLSKGYEKFKEILKKNLHFASHKYANSMWFKFIKFKSQCPVAVVVDQLAERSLRIPEDPAVVSNLL